MKRLFLSLIFSFFGLLSYAQGLPVGTQLPKAVFYTSDGKTFSTEQIAKDKKSLLMFFDATCGHCQRVAAHLSKNTKSLGGANIYLITQDEQASIDYYINNFAKPLVALKNVTVLRDRDHVFIPLFHPRQFPALYLFSPDRRLIFFSSDEKEASKFVSLIK